MAVYTITNPVPTPEEMAEILGMSPERLQTLRKIMSTPVPYKKRSRSRGKTARRSAAKTSRRVKKS